MATRDRNTLKTYFETGDRPKEQQFADLIDSMINIADDGISIDDINGIRLSTNSTDRLTVASDGNIGIGASSPQIHLAIGDDNTGLQQEGAGELAIYTDNNERMRIDNNGNIGIGTDNPSAPLQVIASSETSPTDNGLYVYNPLNAANQHAILSARVAGAGAGNPYVAFDIDGVQGWVAGIDNQDNDKFKISSSWNDLSINTRLTITANGDVGIGTTDPQAPLDVVGIAHFSGDASPSTPNQGAYIGWNARVTGETNFINCRGLGPGGFAFYNIDNGASANGTDPQMLIGGNGNVGIGTTIPNQLLTVNGNASKLAPGDWLGISDRRLKKNIKPFKDSLNLLKKVMPVWYRYNGKAGINNDDENVGIIAQEIREVFPYMVSSYKAKLNKSDKKETDLLTFNGSALRFVIINAIKELDERLAKLELQIAANEVNDITKTVKK